MNKIYFQRWVFSKIQDIQSSIEVLDGYNKTRYGRKKKKDEKLLFEAAKSAHENELIYFVTVYENEKPFCYLEINKGFFRVCFLDKHLRKYLSYDFTDNFEEIKPDKLFLNKITFWEFHDASDKIIKITNHIFKTDGTFIMIERNLLTNEQVDSTAKTKIDVSSNWEDYPKFGDYNQLIVKERTSIRPQIKEKTQSIFLNKNEFDVKKNGLYRSKETKNHIDWHSGHKNETKTYYYFKFFDNMRVGKFSSQDHKFDINNFLEENPDYILKQKGKYNLLDNTIEMTFGYGQFAVHRNFKIISTNELQDENQMSYIFVEHTF